MARLNRVRVDEPALLVRDAKFTAALVVNDLSTTVERLGLRVRKRSRALVFLHEVPPAMVTFSSASVGRLASTLHLLLRKRAFALPDDPELLDELANVRLRETSPGVLRMAPRPARRPCDRSGARRAPAPGTLHD